MTTIGLYFAGLGKSETNALRARLNALAAEYGFAPTRGRAAGRGGLSAMLRSIDAFEANVILVPEDHKPLLTQWLRGRAAELESSAGDVATLGLAEDLASIAEAIQPTTAKGVL